MHVGLVARRRSCYRPVADVVADADTVAVAGADIVVDANANTVSLQTVISCKIMSRYNMCASFTSSSILKVAVVNHPSFSLL
jgi:hypothetical protein